MERLLHAERRGGDLESLAVKHRRRRRRQQVDVNWHRGRCHVCGLGRHTCGDRAPLVAASGRHLPLLLASQALATQDLVCVLGGVQLFGSVRKVALLVDAGPLHPKLAQASLAQVRLGLKFTEGVREGTLLGKRAGALQVVRAHLGLAQLAGDLLLRAAHLSGNLESIYGVGHCSRRTGGLALGEDVRAWAGTISGWLLNPAA
mmetsp:Transcript_70940/g.185990  ORF Transcript_70940/g.185990 Transcript_70940/m.185990 type:complete len:203 (-) Transcript_70940:3-611(-)